jgi:hypothetical protein
MVCNKTVFYINCNFQLQYFSIDAAHLMYNTHPKLFRHSVWGIDNAHEANKL